jgi:hypothetical protein
MELLDDLLHLVGRNATAVDVGGGQLIERLG